MSRYGKNSLSSVSRASLLGLGIVVILFASLFMALLFRHFQRHHQAIPTSFPTPVSEIGRLEFVDGQQMHSDNYNFTTEIDGPSPLQLPLRTLADFSASETATLAHLDTNRGRLTVELYPDQAPLTVANFVHLVRQNFYNGLHFHRVEPGFVAQIGDPASRNVSNPEDLMRLGTGYPGYRLEDEFGVGLSHNQVGILSMANININGNYPHSGGSQFFITLAPATYLDGRHAIFGRVIEGQEILPQLEVGDEITAITLDDTNN